MRCHIIMDQSASMHYPIIDDNRDIDFNKIEFSALACSAVAYTKETADAGP